MLRSYCKMYTGDYQMIEVAYDYNPRTKKSIVYFEKPDAQLGFKMLECELPSYTVRKCVGFTDTERAFLMNFCMMNADLLLSVDD